MSGTGSGSRVTVAGIRSGFGPTTFCRVVRFLAAGVWRRQEVAVPRGDKSSYTDKQKRQAEHIEQGYEERGVGHDEAERRAWATVNKQTGGGRKSGSGRGAGSSGQTHAQRSAAARKGWETRRQRSHA